MCWAAGPSPPSICSLRRCQWVEGCSLAHASSLPLPSTPVLVVRAERDPSKRIVVTGMGIASVFGNDVNTFYDKCVFSPSPFFFASSLPAAARGCRLPISLRPPALCAHAHAGAHAHFAWRALDMPGEDTVCLLGLSKPSIGRRTRRLAPPKSPHLPCPPAAGRPPLTLNHSLPFSLSSPSLLAGKSGVAAIDRFDATEFPTKFAAQIRNFDNEE